MAESGRRRGDSPADTLISPRLWKHVALSCLALIAWSTMLYIGDRVDQQGSGWQNIIGLSTGKIVPFFSTVMLLAAGQLAFITLWYRSRSRKDFTGSYKLWFWVAVSWLVLCAFRATGSHWSLADAILKQRELSVWNARLLLWLAPATISVVALYRLLLREMRDCDVSRWLLRLSTVPAIASGSLLLLGSLALDARWQTAAEVGTASLWHVLLALSMLFHTRHVVHFSNEPPTRPIRRIRLSIPRLSIPRLRLPRLRRSATGEQSTKSRAKTRSARESAETTGETPSGNPSKARKKAAPKRTSGSSRSRTATAAAKADTSDESESIAEPVKTRAATRQPPVEEIDDDEPLPEDDAVPEDVTAEAYDEDEEPARAPQRTAPPIQRRVDPPQSLPKPRSVGVAEHRQSPALQDDDDEDDSDSDDTGSMQGLSKKERKKLRRLQKQKERTR